MKTRDQRSFENQNAQRETDQRDRAGGRDRQTDVTRPEDRPQKNCEHNDRQSDKHRHCPFGNAALRIVPHQQTENRASEHADQQLAGHCRSDAELLQMIVTANAAHQPKERPRFNENGKAVTDDHERRRDAKEREQQHHDGHRKSSNQASQQAGCQRFTRAHDLLRMLKFGIVAREGPCRTFVSRQ